MKKKSMTQYSYNGSAAAPITFCPYFSDRVFRSAVLGPIILY